MERRLLRFLGGSGKTKAEDDLELRLIPAAALLQARQEAQTLAGGDEALLGLCFNACIVAQAAYRPDGARVFESGEAVLKRIPAERIGAWAGKYLALCGEAAPRGRDAQESLQRALEDAPYERLKWRVLRAFGVLPSEKRAKEMTDRDYLYCVMQLTLDEEQALAQLCPQCREQARQRTCPCCGAALGEENGNFDEARFEELKHGGVYAGAFAKTDADCSGA